MREMEMIGSLRKVFYVYILASKPGGVIYVGLTSDLVARVYQHREGLIPGFTKRYFVRRLVYFETHASFEEAVQREKSLKRWRREWKMQLIEKEYGGWRDLYDEL